jgi:hypothetical protein
VEAHSRNVHVNQNPGMKIETQAPTNHTYGMYQANTKSTKVTAFVGAEVDVPVSAHPSDSPAHSFVIRKAVAHKDS